MSKAFDSSNFLKQWKRKKEQLFALAVVRAGLERQGNLDAAAEQEISAALKEFDISEKEFRKYLQKNRRQLLRFLDSRPE